MLFVNWNLTSNILLIENNESIYVFKLVISVLILLNVIHSFFIIFWTLYKSWLIIFVKLDDAFVFSYGTVWISKPVILSNDLPKNLFHPILS